MHERKLHACPLGLHHAPPGATSGPRSMSTKDDRIGGIALDEDWAATVVGLLSPPTPESHRAGRHRRAGVPARPGGSRAGSSSSSRSAPSAATASTTFHCGSRARASRTSPRVSRTPVYAIVLDLLGNIVLSSTGLRERLSGGFRTEFFIRTGLVLLGASINLSVLVNAAGPAIAQALLPITPLFAFTWWLAGRLGLDQKIRARVDPWCECRHRAARALAGEDTLQIAAIVKTPQNALIGFVAVGLVGRLLHLPGGAAHRDRRRSSCGTGSRRSCSASSRRRSSSTRSARPTPGTPSRWRTTCGPGP
ncbi:hypothetical protein CLV71_102212 [Actinophytocola oryzae]|uniref:Uncharacterized protein n=1 Tax=Actinophytocola oryzae TaxID=502181 RepID=A0A4R7W0U3_9PSEU|nr:hypothetical protein CLV71_102212 [Actinophytocola oryzae]